MTFSKHFANLLYPSNHTTVYPFISIFSAWYIVNKQISYGPMKTYEDKAKKDKIAVVKGKENNLDIYKVLFHTFIFTLPFLGIIFEIVKNVLFAYKSQASMPLLKTFLLLDLTSMLSTGSAKGFLIMLLIIILNRILSIKALLKSFLESAKMIIFPVTLISLAGCFSEGMLGIINIDHIYSIVENYSFINTLLPAVFYILLIALSVLFSSCWAAILMMVPLIKMIKVISIWPKLLGASVSGIIAGTHIAPGCDLVGLSSSSLKISYKYADLPKIFYCIPGFQASYHV
jgi:hypothetical protein